MRTKWLGVAAVVLLGAAACGSSVSPGQSGKTFVNARAKFQSEWNSFTQLVYPGNKSSLSQVQAEGQKVASAIGTLQQTVSTISWPASAKPAVNAEKSDAAKVSHDVSNLTSTEPLKTGSQLAQDYGSLNYDLNQLDAALGEPTPSA